MKQLFILAALCLCFGGMLRAQSDTFTIRGNIKHFTNDHLLVLFNNTGGSFVIDTLHVRHGKFVYTGQCAGRERRMMMLAGGKQHNEFKEKGKGKSLAMYGSFDLSFFVHPGADIRIAGDANHFPFMNLKDKKNPINEDFIALKLSTREEQQEINRLHYTTNEAAWNGDKETASTCKKRMAELSEAITAKTRAWIAAHPNREYAAYLYLNSGLTGISPNDIRAQYNKFTPDVQQSEYGRNLLAIMETREQIAVGKIAPDFTLTDVNTGKELSLSDYKGKYVILDFWGSWCHPCRASHPHLREIYSRYRGEKFDILGIAADRKSEVIRKAATEDQVTWPQASLYEKREGQKSMDKLYDVSAFPTKFLINPKGMIEAIYIGDSKELDRKLEELIGK